MIHAVRLLVLLLVLAAVPVRAEDTLADLARDVERTESVRAVKDLQREYAQLAQHGQWTTIGDLFAPDGRFVFDGLIEDAQTFSGREEIAAFLRNRYGGGHEGLTEADVSTLLIDEPLITLASDGKSAKGRWSGFFLLAHGGEARIEGGIFENDYARTDGGWVIESARYYPLYEGPYSTGWTNWGGGDLPLVPYHFTPENAGIPIPPAEGEASADPLGVPSLAGRIGALNAEDTVRNLQSALGYYIDRKMWDDVVDMFDERGSVTNNAGGAWKGKAAIRQWLEDTMGPAGLGHGELNDRPQFDVTVGVMPDGKTAFVHGIELAMLGDADEERGSWALTEFHNMYVKQDGIWKLATVWLNPQFSADYDKGWASGTSATFLRPPPIWMAPASFDYQWTEPTLPELRRRLARSQAYDGVENVSAAYTAFLDDLQSDKFGELIAKDGFKMSAFAGFYVGKVRVKEAGVRVWGAPKSIRSGIAFHWRVQPVILVSEDGRSANMHVRLWQPRTSKDPGQAGAFFGAGFITGKYHDQFVLEDGAWRMFNLSLDEPYMTTAGWKGGWARVKDPVAQTQGATSILVRDDSDFKPDVPMKALGKRVEHIRGGTGETWQWPTIQPMWFEYVNPVSGRVPEFYQEDCMPCTGAPQLRLDRNGYQQPPVWPQEPE
jgi:hypothetical protein